MFFDLQRFDTLSGPKWIRDGVLGESSSLNTNAAWCFIPAGKTYASTYTPGKDYDGDGIPDGPGYTTYSPNGNETIRIKNESYSGTLVIAGNRPAGVEGFEGATSTTTTATLVSGVAISDILVTGSDRNLLRITIDGVKYMVDDDGHLVEVPTAVDISGSAWYALYSEQTTFGWLSTDSTTANAGYLDDNDSSVTIWITNLSAMSGTATAATGTLASGKAISDVTVTGTGASSLHVTIGGTEYLVNGSGKLVIAEHTGADALRRVVQSANVDADTLRRVVASELVLADALRRIIRSEALEVDALRRIIRGESLELDTLRRVALGETFGGDTLLKIICGENFAADVLRRIIQSETIDADTLLEIICSENIAGDTLAKILRAESALADTLLKIGVGENAVADTLREIISSEHTIGDTERILLGKLVETYIINRVKNSSGKTVTRKVSGVNPNASDENLATFMDALNSLTTNRKDKILRANKNVLQ